MLTCTCNWECIKPKFHKLIRESLLGGWCQWGCNQVIRTPLSFFFAIRSARFAKEGWKITIIQLSLGWNSTIPSMHLWFRLTRNHIITASIWRLTRKCFHWQRTYGYERGTFLKGVLKSFGNYIFHYGNWFIHVKYQEVSFATAAYPGSGFINGMPGCDEKFIS